MSLSYGESISVSIFTIHKMKKSTAIKLKQVSGLSIQAGVCLLLFLYLAAFLFPQGAPHVHIDQALHEGDACKKDACHIAIYHPGNKDGCHHKFHFTKAPEECLLCHSIVTRHLPLHIGLPQELVCATPSYTPSAKVGKEIALVISHDDRGPPFSLII